MSVGEKKRFYPTETDYRLKWIDPNGHLSEPQQLFWQSENKAYADIQTIKALFYSEDWVFTCVDAIAQPISTLPISVFKVTNENGEEVKTRADHHPVSKILKKPNRFQNRNHFLYSMAADYILAGNSYAWKGEAGGLYHIPAEQVVYDFSSKNALPDGYLIMADAESGLATVTKKASINEMAHAKRPNPSSAIYGLSPFVPGRRSILFNRYSAEYLNNFYLKGASPQFILEMDATANEKSITRLLASFESAYTGRRNQRRTLVLPKGVKAQPADTKIADQQLQDLIRMNRENILAVLRIPKHAVGLQESGSLGSEEHRQALKYFWQTTISDTAKAIAEAINSVYYSVLGDGYCIDFDFSSVEELRDDETQKATLSRELLSIMTPNEVRKKIWKLPPVSGGDEIIGMVQQSIFSPQQPETTQPQPDITEPKTKNLLGFKFEDNHLSAIKAYDDELKKVDEKLFKKRMKSGADLITKQIETALDIFVPTKKANPDKKELRKRILKAYDAMEKDYLSEAEGDLEQVVSIGYDSQVSLVFNIDAREALQAVKERDAKGRRKVLTDRNLFSFKSVSKTNLERVMKEIERGLAEGLGVNEVAQNIASSMLSGFEARASTIARTEIMNAMTVGQQSVFAAAKAAGVSDLKKVWVTAGDDRVRDEHADEDVNGQVRKEGEPFDVGGEKLMYPRDPSGSAWNTINCRCTVIMIPSDEMADFSDDIEQVTGSEIDGERE